MISQKYKEMLGAKSVIRQMSEWATGRSKEIGSENVFDFSLGNPNLPAPQEVEKAIRGILEEEDSILIHGYMNNYPFSLFDNLQSCQKLSDIVGFCLQLHL